MPGFSEGMHNVSRDEQRHIGFGVKVLSDCFRETDECKAAVAEILREVMPYSVAVFTPPGGISSTRAVTASSSRTSSRSGCARSRPSGRRPDTRSPRCPRHLPVRPVAAPGGAGAARDHPDARRRGGRAGRQRQTPRPRSRRCSSTSIARSAHKDAVNGKADDDPVALQDAAPWYVRIDNGNSEATQGLAARPDLTLDTSWRDWVELSTYGGRPAARDASAASSGRADRVRVRCGGCSESSRGCQRAGQRAPPGCPRSGSRERRPPHGRSQGGEVAVGVGETLERARRRPRRTCR